MNFKFKLSQRLARMRLAALVSGSVLLACKLTQAGPIVNRVDHIDVTPARMTLQPTQSADLILTAATSRGDTNPSSLLSWITTGGIVTGTYRSAGVQHLVYQAPPQPGNYYVIVRATTGFPADSASVLVTTTVVPVRTVSVAPATVNIAVNDTVRLRASLADSTGSALFGRTIQWTTSDAAVATVLTGGLVRGIAPGTVTITALSEDHTGTAVVTVH